jgi:hypothetical protein
MIDYGTLDEMSELSFGGVEVEVENAILGLGA